MTDPNSVSTLAAGFFRRNRRDLIAALTRRYGAAALSQIEDAVQIAFALALDKWSMTGPPNNPGGWLYRVSENALRDMFRSSTRKDAKSSDVEHALYSREEPDSVETAAGSDVLRMILVCCHPTLSERESIAITLRLVCSLGIEEIANALHLNYEAVRKLIQRTKAKIKKHQIPFDPPNATEMQKRLDRVLQILYLLYNEGYVATVGESLTRADLCREAQSLCEILVSGSSTCEDTRVWALAALMAFQSARFQARTDAEGRPILLLDQDRSLWDRASISEGFILFSKSIGGDRSSYHLEAAIAACHAAAATAEDTDWRQILEYYDDLMILKPSPIVSLNRIVVIMMVHGSEQAWADLQPLRDDPALRDHPILAAVSADILRRVGKHEQAAGFLESASASTKNDSLKEFFAYRRDAVMAL